MAIRDIRNNRDLDIIIKEKLWKELVRMEKMFLESSWKLKFGNLEFYTGGILYEGMENMDKLIDNAEIIEGILYVRLEVILEWKKRKNRLHDKKEIKLIENYLNQNNNH